MRITPQTMLNNALASLDRHTNRLGKLQAQAASGKKLERPSDNPGDLGLLLAAKAQDQRLEQYVAGIRASRSSLEVSTAALQDAGNVLSQARAIAIEASHSVNSPQALEAFARQVDGLLNRLAETANQQYAGRYLFAGAASETKPFEIVRDSDGRPVAARYEGASLRDAAPISPGQTVATLYSGEEIFQKRQRGTTVYLGTTGAAPGTGLDNASGQGALLVSHTITNYAAGSGVQPGTGSLAGDTIIGPAGAHQLTLVDTSGTGAFGTVSLNGGPAVPFTSADTNLKVIGAAGEVVFIDTTAIAAGFNGAVAITADGTLSTDGGATTVPIDFSANQIVIHGANGSVTNIDTTAVRRAGTEQLEYRGAYDAFEILMTLRDDLRNLRGLTEGEQLEAISSKIGELNRVRDNILNVVGEQSASLQHLEAMESFSLDVQLRAKELTANLEDADLSQLVLEMQSRENLLRLALAASARLYDQSLLDFLR
jgi:flagellar hook-associated protein 3 FlgL